MHLERILDTLGVHHSFWANIIRIILHTMTMEATRDEVEMEDNEEGSIEGYESDPNQVTRGVSRGAIEKLERKSYSVGEAHRYYSICLEELDEKYKVMEIPCSNLLHNRCIVKWLERNNSHPLCHGKVQVQDSE
ncbi:hypothetical protein ACJRO7_014990 [Eucalyptus globulus]|uniref:RING-type domain-containing protein n=1 Tax=Eucalyptus globulus TaxID=34317 RepID=A0ABD3L7T5_EUCGL